MFLIKITENQIYIFFNNLILTSNSFKNKFIEVLDESTTSAK